MMAVFKIFKAFLLLIQNQLILVFQYINRMGGTKSEDLCDLTCYLLQWGIPHQINLIATYIPGKDNLQADLLSRTFLLYQLVVVKQSISEVVPTFFNLENRFIVTSKNSKLPMFCSFKFHQQAESTNVGKTIICTLSLFSSFSTEF